MVGESGLIHMNMCDDAKQNARLNVLYSPFRKKEVNPEDWESKMNFWKCNISNWCRDSHVCVFSLCKLQSAFVRNGRQALCLGTVLENMLRDKDIILLEDLLSKNQQAVQSWSSWAVNSFVKAPLVWSLYKMKESLISKPKSDREIEYVHVTVLKKQAEDLKDICWSKYGQNIITLDEIKAIVGVQDEQSLKAVLHWLQLQSQASMVVLNNKTLVKFGQGGEKVSLITEADVGLYRLQHNERTLMQMLEQLETERQAIDQEARTYLNKGMRHVAKTCLRKRKELEKCINKRASALENVQVLISRVKEAESDSKILESYRVGLEALKATFKSAGLSEESVGETMDQVREVLEAHEEVQGALSEPLDASLDEDLENELAELLGATTIDVSSGLQELPEPPVDPPTLSPATSLNKGPQQLAQ